MNFLLWLISNTSKRTIMNAKNSLGSLVSFLTLIMLFSDCSQKEHDSDRSERPNIIFIMSDDHTSQAVSAYGGILAEVCPTPNIDRIANEGILFSNCFVTNSICTPSRAAIFTGRYAHQNGVYKFTALDQSQPTLPKAMQEKGYQTAFVGKYHLHSNPRGLDYFAVLPGQGRYHDPEFVEVGDTHPSGWVAQGKRTVYQGHSSDVIADKALDYLQNQREEGKPFMLFTHFKAPHDTWEYAERYESFLEDVEVPEPDNLFDDYSGRSDALKTQLQYIGSEWGDHTNFEQETAHLEGRAKKKMQYQLYIKKYLRCVKGVDDNVGRILDYLEKSGLAENTIIVYTGDQGFYLGEHGLYDKRFMYEEGLRMPFLVRWPEKIKAGSRSDAMILNVDFAPTILDAAGQEPLEGTQGRSFLPILEDGAVPSDWRNSMYYRYYYSHFETEPHYGVRTYDHKLIYYNEIDQWELYDINRDPSEMNNLYNDPDYQEIAEALKSELYRLQKDLGDHPDDDGSKPNIGDLTGSPLAQSGEVSFSKGDATLLMRFRTDVGGTLFSKCRIGDTPWSEEIADEGMKTLFIRKGTLMYMDFTNNDDAQEIAADLDDNQWHTIAFITKNGYPNIYIDDKLKYTADKTASKDNDKHTFNVGAGIDYSGYNGYNFVGEISDMLVYDGALSGNQITAYDNGNVPKGNIQFRYANQ